MRVEVKCVLTTKTRIRALKQSRNPVNKVTRSAPCEPGARCLALEDDDTSQQNAHRLGCSCPSNDPLMTLALNTRRQPTRCLTRMNRRYSHAPIPRLTIERSERVDRVAGSTDLGRVSR